MKIANITINKNLRIAFVPMTLDDIKAIIILENRCFPSSWSADTYRNDLSNNPHSFYWTLRLTNPSHTSNSDILTYGGYWIMGDEAHIVTIATDPDWRRKNLGACLLLKMLAEMRNHSVTQATLEVRASNQAAVQLYKKFGFIKVGQRPKYYRNPQEDALLLTLFGLDDDVIWQSLCLQIEENQLELER